MREITLSENLPNKIFAVTTKRWLSQVSKKKLMAFDFDHILLLKSAPSVYSPSFVRTIRVRHVTFRCIEPSAAQLDFGFPLTIWRHGPVPYMEGLLNGARFSKTDMFNFTALQIRKNLLIFMSDRNNCRFLRENFDWLTLFCARLMAASWIIPFVGDGTQRSLFALSTIFASGLIGRVGWRYKQHLHGLSPYRIYCRSQSSENNSGINKAKYYFFSSLIFFLGREKRNPTIDLAKNWLLWDILSKCMSFIPLILDRFPARATFRLAVTICYLVIPKM